MMNKKLNVIVLVITMIAQGMNLNAQDWPRWHGVNNDNIVNEAGLHLDWTTKKPPLVWTFKQAGAGFSSPSIVGTTLYCMGAADGNDFAFALDTQTGKMKWKQELGKDFTNSWGNGPRGTITVDGDKIYVIRGAGKLHCLSAADGKKIWEKDLVADLGGKMMSGWGYSESPLIDGNLVICTPGYHQDRGQGTMAALDKNSGAVVWTSKDWKDEAAYSSTIVADVDGVRQYIQQSAKGVAGVAAKDGKLLWRVEVDGYRTAVIPSPVYTNNMVYVTSGYNAGCVLVKLSKSGESFKAETVYANKNMVNQHGGVVLVDGHIYGFSDASGWVCQNLKTGEQAWAQRVSGVGKGTVLAVNDRLLCMVEGSGLIAVAASSPDGWKEYGRMEIPERSELKTQDGNMVWTHLVVANGKLYLRDQNLLFCFDLKR